MVFSQSKQLLKISCTNFWLKVDILTRNIVFTLYNVCSVHRGIPWIHRGDIMSTSGDVQYIGGYHDECGGIPWVHQGMFSTWEGYHEYIGGNIMSTSGDVQYIGGISWYMWGSNLIKSFQFLLKTPMYWTSPRCTEHPPMYSWYPPDVLMISPRCTHGIHPDVLNIPRCTHGIPHMYHDIPPMYWTSADVLMISPDVLMVSLRCTEHPRCTHGIPPMYWTPPDVLMISFRCTHGIPRCTHGIPRCTHGIPPMYSWYPPDVLNTPPCTEHPPMYWTHIIQGGFQSCTLWGITITVGPRIKFGLRMGDYFFKKLSFSCAFLRWSWFFFHKSD